MLLSCAICRSAGRFVFRMVAITLIGVLCCAEVARAEVFHLASGGTIEGVLLNPDESPRSTYEVKTDSGTLVLGKTQVRQVVAFSVQLKQYEQFLPRMPETVEGHMQMALWCNENNLPDKRDDHLNEIISREPDHAEARRMLGYERFQNRWIIREEWMRNQGYVRTGGAWRFPQDVKMMDSQRQVEEKQVQWRRQLRIWKQWLGRGGDRAREAAKGIGELNDPYAAQAVIELVDGEKNATMRELLVRALMNIDTPDSTFTLTKIAVGDPSESIRDLATIALEKREHSISVSYLIKQLESADNAQINRAAIVLGRLKHPASALPLMNALVTTHKYMVQKGGQPGQTTASFGGGGGTGGLPGMSFGTPKAETMEQDQNNPEVLSALLKVTGEQVNFQYNEARWKVWYANEKIPLSIDLRRDG